MTTPTPFETAEMIKRHHVQLHDGLRERVDALRAAVREGAPWEPPRDEVVGFLEGEILPHARAEEQTLYRAADTGASALLVQAMLVEHVDLVGRFGELRAAADPIDAVSQGSAILALFESHLGKENDRLIPALLARPDVSLAELLEGMHELVG